MIAPIKKAAGGFKTTTATATHNATYFIAAGASKTSAGQGFHACPGQRTDRLEYRTVRLRDTIHIGAQNTIDNAGNLPDSEVFSRPEFKVLGVGIAYPQGRQHGVIHVFKPSSTRYRLNTVASGFQSHNGARTMTTVNTTTTPKTGNTATLARQQAIENALTTALYFIRLPTTDSGLRAATGRAIRAASMLKQACAEISNGERV